MELTPSHYWYILLVKANSHSRGEEIGFTLDGKSKQNHIKAGCLYPEERSTILSHRISKRSKKIKHLKDLD